MERNGFTLIEMLGVIVILSVLSLIAVPVIDRSLNQGRENLSKIQERQLIKSLKNYYAEHLSEFNDISTNEGSPTCKSSDDLKDFGYLPTDLKNPKTGDDLTVWVCAWKDGNKIKYFVKEA
ncbi:MAG: type II secretion system protein [Bacilli bacterium]|nr:type II secretion system protein [Bacilli bacterium]